MKIHVWGINYSPELSGIAPYNAALCESLSARGYSTRMITSFCYYPSWQKLPTERRLLFRTDQCDGVTVHRCWHFVPRKVTTLKRIVHELTFVFSSFLRQLFLPRPDLLVIISPPLLLGPAAWLLSRVKGGFPFVFHIQDLQPDAAAGLGMVNDGLLLKTLRKIELFTYEKAAKISAITPGMLRVLEHKGVPKTKLACFPNGVEIPDFWRLPEKGRFRAANAIAPDDFLVVYSGNLGRKQGLELLLDAARFCANPRVKFVIGGDGAERTALEKRAGEMRLSNVRFLPLLPEPRYREMLVDADLAVVCQKAGSGDCFFPSKLLKALAFGCPLLALADENSELHRAVREGRFGLALKAENPKAIASRLEELLHDPSPLNGWRRAGLKFVKRFEQSKLLDAFIAELEEVKKRLVKLPAATEQGGTEAPSVS